MKWFWRSIAKSESGGKKKKRGKNQQISIFGFQCVAKKHNMTIKGFVFHIAKFGQIFLGMIDHCQKICYMFFLWVILPLWLKTKKKILQKKTLDQKLRKSWRKQIKICWEFDSFLYLSSGRNERIRLSFNFVRYSNCKSIEI
jgi:hypothetical protein